MTVSKTIEIKYRKLGNVGYSVVSNVVLFYLFILNKQI